MALITNSHDVSAYANILPQCMCVCVIVYISFRPRLLLLRCHHNKIVSILVLASGQDAFASCGEVIFFFLSAL